jgi:branched-chain amino acid transport system permease protein
MARDAARAVRGLYPVFMMKALCFALFACAFNLLLGFTGLLSFGHAAFLGFAAYVTAARGKVWGWSPELGILAGTLCRGRAGPGVSAAGASAARASTSR